MAWGANILWGQAVVHRQLNGGWAKARAAVAKDAVKVRQEHRKDRCRNVEGWGKDDANVPDSHLVHIGVVNNLD